MVPFQGQMLFSISYGYSKFSTCRLEISPKGLKALATAEFDSGGYRAT
jgi:hypothetical protein